MLSPYHSAAFFIHSSLLRHKSCKVRSVQKCAKVCKGVRKCARWLKSTSQKKETIDGRIRRLSLLLVQCIHAAQVTHRCCMMLLCARLPVEMPMNSLDALHACLCWLLNLSYYQLPAGATGMQNDALRCTKYQTNSNVDSETNSRLRSSYLPEYCTQHYTTIQHNKSLSSETESRMVSVSVQYTNHSCDYHDISNRHVISWDMAR